MKLSVLKVLLASTFLSTASAQDTLYQAAPPPNASFVRVVNALSGSALKFSLAGSAFEAALASHEVGPYHMVPKGTPVLEVDGLRLQQALHLSAGRFYTVAVTGTRQKPALTVLSEAPNPNVAQVRIGLYNLSTSNVSLLTADGKATLFKNQGPLSVNTLNVNPVNVQLRVDRDSQTLTTLEATKLQVWQAYSVFVFDGSPMTASFVASTTKP
ncbi:alginate O-acetyltransferase AlgF (plasmid) [Deinococcus sp. KNUC1210]|uniref:alginate O-acetyltransferase AlgF n=1 Tax=Deinococcus sp. KNUC1210 TaxID=2917691 RepID=UPI001EEF85C9|nr:alginate O-acetyltransferase AlgF [Deinococcus sp. KNUC1210]ULH17485.1 alginate O-acetyltransferase AlgF [Deinococcus sp. KNUC1210]